MEGPVIIIVENRDGKLRNVSFEVATTGRKLADDIGGELTALSVGNTEEALSKDLGMYGVDKIFNITCSELNTYSTDGYAKVLAEVVEKVKPSVILMSASAMGKDLAPRLAAKLNIELISDCIEITASGGTVEAKRPVFAGKAYATVKSDSRIKFITIRPKIFPAEVRDEGKSSQVEDYTADLSGYMIKSSVKEIVKEQEGKVDLTEADVIVTGGRGMKGPENYKVIEELADVLNAVVGASRASVDAGWRPHSDQVGQTGTTVRPALYIACGISGAVQHRAGMEESAKIIAINSDKEAPIFSVAHYGIVGDLRKVIPTMIKAIKERA